MMWQLENFLFWWSAMIAKSLEILIFPVWFITLNSLYTSPPTQMEFASKKLIKKKINKEIIIKKKKIWTGREESSFLIIDEFPFQDTIYVQAQLRRYSLQLQAFF